MMLSKQAYRPAGHGMRPLILLGAVGLFLGAGFLRAADVSAAVSPIPLEARIKQALGEPGLEQQLKKLSDVGETLSEEEIPKALALAGSLKLLRERGVLRESALKRWARLNPAKAFEAIRQLPEGRDKAGTAAYVISRWTVQDARQASEAVVKLPPGRSRLEACGALASAWAEKDPKAAVAWADKLPFGSTKESALNNIRFVWVHRDPRAASVHVAATVERGNIKNALLTNIAEEWALLDPAGAVVWAKSLTYPDEKELALSNVADSWANRQPRAAADFALKLSPAGVRNRAVVAVVGRWSTQEPARSAEWAMKISDEGLRRESMEPAVALWAAVAPAEAGAWVETQKTKSWYPLLVEKYVTAVTPWAPDLGVKIVARSAPQLNGSAAVEACARQWLQLDPYQAGEWIALSAFPEETKAKWTSPVRN